MLPPMEALEGEEPCVTGFKVLTFLMNLGGASREELGRRVLIREEGKLGRVLSDEAAVGCLSRKLSLEEESMVKGVCGGVLLGEGLVGMFVIGARVELLIAVVWEDSVP